MLIRIITSCTGEKAVTHDHHLTLADFRQGRQQIAARESELNGSLAPAMNMYSGLQHQRLLRGIRMLESSPSAELTVETWIVSAGYGLIAANQKIAPYEATFIGMSSADRRKWARQLEIPSSVRKALAQPADLIFLLLGDDYLAGCEIDDGVTLGGPCLLFCGKHAAKRLPNLPGLHKIELGNSHAKRFSCGLVGLKGELTSRFLEGLASGLITIKELESASNPLCAFGKPA